MSPGITYRADIDGLRAIAILLVVIFHFDLLSAGKGGFIGVDVFFVISGFLITGIIARDIEQDRFRLGTFLYRRIRRLYPAVLATLILYLAFGYVFFLPDLFAELAIEALLSQVYAVNIYFWRTVNYFGLQAGSVPLLHMWSLAVEEQFYLLFPIFCLLCHRWFPGRLLWALIALTLLSLGLGVIASTWKPEAAFYLLPTRAWELAAGGVLALAVRGWTPSRTVAMAAGPVGLGLILVALAIHTPALAVPGWFAMLPVLGAMALLLGGLHADVPFTRLMATGPMVWIGQISYPLYLVHWPVIISVQEMVPEAHLGWRLFGFTLSFGLAWAIYAAIERPVRSQAVLARPGRFLTAALGTTLAIVIVSGLIAQRNGMPQRFDPPVQKMLAYAQDLPEPFRDCDHRGQPLDAMCRLGDTGAAPDRLVIGDSHARALAGALDLWLQDRGEAARFSFAHSCLPVLQAGPVRCERYAQAVIDQALASDAITEIILVSAWRQPFEGGMNFGGSWYSGTDTHTPFTSALTRTVETLRQAGKRVMIVEPLFASPRFVPETAARNLAFGRNWSVDKPLAQYRATFAPLFAAFDAVEQASIRRVSLLEPFCDDAVCRGLYQGRPVFTDNNHLAFGLSRVVADTIARQIE